MGNIKGVLKEMAWVLVLLLLFTSVSYVVFGLPQPLVAVESGSMEPHLFKGDVSVINAKADKIITWEEGKETGYTSFGDFGDVVLYHPFGSEGTPVIHRAMYYVEKGEPMWEGGPPAPYAGYITKGDNPVTNRYYDQQGNVCYMAPVKPEWVVGVAEFRIPKVGYITLAFRGLMSLTGMPVTS